MNEGRKGRLWEQPGSTEAPQFSGFVPGAQGPCRVRWELGVLRAHGQSPPRPSEKLALQKSILCAEFQARFHLIKGFHCR